MLKFLEGIKVVELGTHVAIPQAARLMADYGASVIKVESIKGDAWRIIGMSYDVPYENDCNPVFQNPNSGKRSIAVDLKSEEGKEVLFKLLENADVFLSNTRMKGLRSLGLSYEDIKDRFPRLIYAHFTGYGEYGPDKDRPGFDIAAYWAKAGLPLEWSTKESGPFRPMPGFGDATVSSVILAGVLAALYGRLKTGRGEFMKTSLYGCALWFNSSGIVQAQYQEPGTYPRSMYNQTTPYNIIYKTKDEDYFFFSIPPWPLNYTKLLKYLHLDQYINDVRFATLEGCRENMKFVSDVLAEVFSKMTTDEVSACFSEIDGVYQVIVNPQNVVNDAQAWENDYFSKIRMEGGGEVVLPNSPVQFMSDIPTDFVLAPQLGANSVEILSELDVTDDQIEQYISRGIIRDYNKYKGESI